MEIRYIAVRIDETEWSNGLFASPREAYDHIKTRALNEERPITDYLVKPVEVEI